MAATYVKVPSSLPSHLRVAEITSVETGDKIDIRLVLGRPARSLKFIMAASDDIVEYRLNNLLRLPVHHESGPDTSLDVWSAAPGYTVFDFTGDTEGTIAEELSVDSIEIVDYDGTDLTIMVW